jgi:hypothetical protein
MATVPADPLTRNRHHWAEAAGLGRAKNAALNLGIVLSTAGMVGTSAWSIYVTHVAQSQIQRYVVAAEGAEVLAKFAVSDQWHPGDGVFIDFSRRWIRNLRSRPDVKHDRQVLEFNRNDVRNFTDSRLFSQLRGAMADADKVLGDTPVDVLDVSANVVKHDGNTAMLLVTGT